MLKKIGLFIVVMLSLVVQAQTGKGDWRVHPYYVGDNVKNIIDTDNKVYYLVGNDLYCFDKVTATSESLNKRVALNDVLVTNIYYNHLKKYLVVTYLNSNIDVIMADGQIINLPDIKDAVMTGLKGINDVTFAPGKMLVSTEFGMVIYDDTSLTAIESRLFNVNFASAIEVGGWTVVSYSGKVYAAPTSTTNERYGSYKQITNIPSSSNVRLVAVDNDRFIVNANNGVRVCATISDSTTVNANGSTTAVRYVESISVISSARATTLQRTPSGFVASFPSSSLYITTDALGQNPQQFNDVNELISSNPSGDGTMWGLGADGLHKLGNTDYYKPNGIGIKVGAFYMTFNKPKNLVYLSASSDNLHAEWGSNMGAVTQIFTFDGSQWTDVTPSNLPGSGVSANWQLVMDPLDPNTYVYPSRKYGVFKIVNDQFTYKYDGTNSYFPYSNFYKGACAFDSVGNLWVCYSSEKASETSQVNLSVLPRAKYEAATCTKSDWIPVSVPATKQNFFKGSSFVIGKGDVKVYNGGGYQGSYVFWNQPDGLTSAPQIANFNSLQNVDGKSITWTNVYCMERDQDGFVWAGMNNGIVSFDPSKAFNDDFTVTIPKVNRNDGTGQYDYLLDGLQVNCVSVDANNRKWIGTESAGLYLVSPDGSKILKQFNTENSYLTSNTIYAVCCNTNTNSVYVLTANGFLEYISDANPSAANYDNVYVYPNPVRPDFTGLLTITNLMSNSYLKITNARGETVKQWQAEGGTATWDCADQNGQRMPTGMYNLYASQRQDDPSPRKVAEFLIIK